MSKSNTQLRSEYFGAYKDSILKKEFDKTEKSWNKWQRELRRQFQDKAQKVKEKPPEPNRKTGEVVFYHNEKWYGFVMYRNEKVFIHIKEFKKDEPINRGDYIAYEIKTGKEGRLKAINITKVNRASGQGKG